MSVSMHPFPPELMMQRAELSKARRLLRELDQIHVQHRLDDVLPRAEQRGYEYFTALRAPVWVEMEVLAEEVLRREVGLERYSVIHVVREDMVFRLQVLHFSFMSNFALHRQWAWNLDGRALRKDDTLGVKHARVVFRFAYLERRHLDGIWRELHWRGEAPN